MRYDAAALHPQHGELRPYNIEQNSRFSLHVTWLSQQRKVLLMKCCILLWQCNALDSGVWLGQWAMHQEMLKILFSLF